MKEEIKILSISCYYHDSSAALLINGEITLQYKKRDLQEKNDNSFPVNSINYILKNNLKINQIEHIVFYEKPF